MANYLPKEKRVSFTRLKIAATVLMTSSLLSAQVYADAETEALRAQLRAAQQAIAAMEKRLNQLEAKPVANVTQVNEEVVVVDNVAYQKKPKADPNKVFKVYGFAQVDAIQDFDRVNPDWESTLRASKIPTAQGQYGSNGQSIFSVKQSRLGVLSLLPVNGKTLKTNFEFDLYGTGDDAGQTTMRVRQAYGEWGEFLGGQTNSLFMDDNIFPNVIDYWGPSGMVYLRNPQLRWTPMAGENTFAVALENPGNDISGPDNSDQRFNGTGYDNIQDDEKLPDLTARYLMKRDWGHVQVAGIARRLGYDCANDDPATPCSNPSDNKPSGNQAGYGLDLTSSLKLTDTDTVLLSAVGGKGIAQYMNDGGNDIAFSGSNVNNVNVEAIPLWGLMGYLQHSWSPEYVSSIGYGTTRVSNEDLQPADAFTRGDYASVNLLYTPAKNLMFGSELLHGFRKDNDGETGYDTRIQFSAKYIFDSTDYQ